MSTRNAITEMLCAGVSDRGIERELGVPKKQVGDLRRELGIPRRKPGPAPASSVEDVFWRRAQPTDDGHLLWPGYSSGHGAYIRHGGRKHSVHRLAFSMAHRREPVGHVESGCGVTGCVHPRCVEDQTMRDQYAAIFGEAA